MNKLITTLVNGVEFTTQHADLTSAIWYLEIHPDKTPIDKFCYYLRENQTSYLITFSTINKIIIACRMDGETIWKYKSYLNSKHNKTIFKKYFIYTGSQVPKSYIHSAFNTNNHEYGNGYKSLYVY